MCKRSQKQFWSNTEFRTLSSRGSVTPLIACALLATALICVTRGLAGWKRQMVRLSNKTEIAMFLESRLVLLRSKVNEVNPETFLRTYATTNKSLFNPILDTNLMDPTSFQAIFGISVTESNIKFQGRGYNVKYSVAIKKIVTLSPYQDEVCINCTLNEVALIVLVAESTLTNSQNGPIGGRSEMFIAL